MADIYIGLMSGTSMDAVDAVAVRFGNKLPELIVGYSEALPQSLRTQLMTLAHGEPHHFADVIRADIQLGKFFAHVTQGLLQRAHLTLEDICAIGSHGQTVWHIADGDERSSIQLGDANIIVELTGITTVADFRRRDIAAGGQGAPLVPAFHAACLRTDSEQRVILNIGGIANITILSADQNAPVIGFDTGPGNTLIDMWAHEHQRGQFDHHGEFAQSGRLINSIVEKLLHDPYFSLPPPKSTGREYFNRQWLLQHIGKLGAFNPADLQTTLTELTALSITQAIEKYAATTQRVLVCGGGIHNAYLMQRLQANLPGIALESTGAYGIDPRWMEAMAFAWLAKQTLEHQPGNLPSVTGAKHPVVLGGVYCK